MTDDPRFYIQHGAPVEVTDSRIYRAFMVGPSYNRGGFLGSLSPSGKHAKGRSLKTRQQRATA